MKKAIPFFAALMLAALVSGCAGPELSEEQLSTIHRVAIVSTVGDELSIEEIPLFPIVVEDDFGPFGQYGLDRYITTAIARKLSPRYQVIPFKNPVHVTQGSKADWWWHDDNYTHIDLPPGGDTGNGIADTYVLITPGTGTIYGTSHQVHGAYVAHHPNLGGPEYGVGVTYHILIVDAKTGKRMKNIQTLAGAETDESLWAEKYVALSDAQKTKIEARIEPAMDASLDYALKKIGLIPDE